MEGKAKASVATIAGDKECRSTSEQFLCFAVAWPYTIRTLVGRKGLSNATGAHHMQMRKVVTPAFTPRVSQQYVPRILEIAEELCAEWAEAKYTKGEDCMKAYTFQVIYPTLLYPALRCPDSCVLVASLCPQGCQSLIATLLLLNLPKFLLGVSTAEVEKNALQTTAVQSLVCESWMSGCAYMVVAVVALCLTFSLYHVCALQVAAGCTAQLPSTKPLLSRWSLRCPLHSGDK